MRLLQAELHSPNTERISVLGESGGAGGAEGPTSTFRRSRRRHSADGQIFRLGFITYVPAEGVDVTASSVHESNAARLHK